MHPEARAHDGRSPRDGARRTVRRPVASVGVIVLFVPLLYIDSLPAASPVINIAHVSASSGPGMPPVVVISNPAVTEIAAVPPVMDKRVSPAGVVQPGDTLVYTLALRNPGASALTNVLLVDPVDPRIDAVTGVTTGSVTDLGPAGGRILLTGAFDPASRQIRWRIPVLGPGSAVEVSFTAHVAVSLAGETVITNRFSVTSDQDPSAVFSPRVSSPVVAPALSLFLQASRETVSVGEMVAFRIQLQNSDPLLDLRSSSVDLRLPEGFRYQEGSLSTPGRGLSPPALSERGRSLNIGVGDLPAGEGLTLTAVGVVTAAAEEGRVRAVARASAVTSTGSPVSSLPSRAWLRVVESLLTSGGTIAGRVFADADGDGAWSPSDPVVPGARLFLEDGTQVLTDGAGKYHVEGMRPGLHVVKLDMETVPAGFRAVATSHRSAGSGGVHFVDLGAGELFKANLGLGGPPGLMSAVEIPLSRGGAAEGPFLRILAAALFHPGSHELRPGAQDHLDLYAEMIENGGLGPERVQVLPAENVLPGLARRRSQVLGKALASLGRLSHAPAAPGASPAELPVGVTGATGASGDPRRAPTPVTAAGAAAPAEARPAAGSLPDPAEAALKGLPRGLHLLAPREGEVVASERIDVDVAFPSGHDLRLAVNGTAVPEERVGVRMQTSRSGMSLHRYIGVSLKPGLNRIEARASFPGQMTQVMEIQVDRVSGPALILVRGAGGAQKADGKSPGRATVQALDERGHPVADGTRLTVTVDRGSILGRDADGVSEGFQVATRGGKATVRLSPATSSESRLLKALAGEVQGEGEIRFEPEMRRWIVAGVGEAGWASTGSALSSEVDRTGISGDPDAAARMALFARGRIGEKDLLSLSWDTGRERDERKLFRVEDPTSPFPVYGDASSQAHTLESQGKLSIRWERDRSMAAWGDFRTGLTAAELARYDRPLSGLQAHVETGRLTVHGFGATTPQTSVRDVMAADGSSGPYRLSRRGIVAYSERVIVEVRDRFKTERVLSSSVRQKFQDYDIDYQAGTILFRAPVAAQDAGFNPVIIAVTFEVADSREENIVAGGRVGYRPSARFELGTTAVREERAGEDFLMTGADFTVRPWRGAALTAEYAGTSGDGGSSGAYAVKFHSPAGGKVGVAAYLRSIPADFSNPSMPGVSEIGTTKTGLELRASLPDGSSLMAEAFRQHQESLDMDRSSASVGWRRPAGPVTWELGGQGLEGTEDGTGERGSSGLLKAGIKARLGPRLDGSLHHQEIVAGTAVTGFPTRTTLGAGYRFSERIRGFLSHEQDRSDLQSTGRSMLGVEGALNEYTTVDSRYALEDALDGERGYAIVGVRTRVPLSDAWTADLRAERADTVTGLGGSDFTALTAGAEYLPGRTKLASRYEVRFGEREDRHLLTTAGAVRLTPGLVLFARNHLNLSQPELADSRLDVDGLLGMAYRPLDADRWSWLGRLEASRGERLPGGGTSLATAPAARGLMGLLEMNFQPVPRWHMLGRYAGRYATDVFSSRSSRSYTEIWEARSMVDIGARATAGLSGRILRQAASETSLTGVGLEGGLLVARDLWLVAGYNITGFSDDRFPDGNRRQQGPFVSLRFKFDEALIGDLFRRKASGGSEEIPPHGPERPDPVR